MSKAVKENFVHLHTHSDFSLLDGCARVEEYVKAAAERGAPAVALTDHGTMRGCYELAKQCDKYGVKPIFGIEFYVCDDMNVKGVGKKNKREKEEETQEELFKPTEEEQKASRKTTHLTAWALDNEGLKNLYRLSSKAWIEGYYYRPRIDLDTLIDHNEGIAIGSGCIGSTLNDAVLRNDKPRIDTILGKLADTFGDRFYIEFMPHILKDNEQSYCNEHSSMLVDLLGGKSVAIATQDAHYLNEEASEHHNVLLAMQTQDVLSNKERFAFSEEHFDFKTRDEMARVFLQNHKWLGEGFISGLLDGTLHLAERCTAKIEIDPLKGLLPRVEVPSVHSGDAFLYLKDLAFRGFEGRNISERARQYAKRNRVKFDYALELYTQRLIHELSVFKKSGFSPYFLILYDMYQMMLERKIAVGPGRGSAAGSLVSYLIGITQVDPIEHRLMFERFIAPGRVNWPDVDCDIQENRVSEVIEYLKQKYGREYVAQISTFGTMSGRQVVKDVARTYEISYQEANIATAGIPDKEADPLKWALEHSKPMKAFAAEYPSAIKHSVFLQGLTKSVGMHAAGVVVSPVPLTDLLPLEVRRPSGEECVVTAFDMHGVEDIGLLKIDLLKLKTCTVLANAAVKIKEVTGEEFDYLALSLEDRETLDNFTKRDFVGVFQFDSQSAYSASEGMNFDCFDDIVAINAINRPGAIDFCDEFKARKKDAKQKSQVMFHESVSEITKNALGLMIYQEHVIKIATDVAGYTLSEADALRKKIGKSMGHAAIEEERPKFVDGCAEKTPSMKSDVAEKLFDAIVKFGRYAFNLSHAVCYSMFAYWTMYLKVHWPLEFYYALMSSEKKLDRIHSFVKDAERHGVKTLLPDINLSGNGFVVNREMNAIVCSLTDIKKVGEKAVEAVVEERDKNGKFKGFTNFLERCRGRAVHKGNIESLALAGAFDRMVPNPRWLVTELPRLWKEIDKKQWDFIERAIDASKSSHQWSEDTRAQYAEEVNPFVARTHISILYSNFIMEHVRPLFTELRDSETVEKKIIWSAARIQDYETRTVGDSVDIENFPSPKVQEKIGWGKEWLRLIVEGVDGKLIWMKVDYQLVPIFKPIVDRVSTPGIIFCAETNPRYGSLILHFMADLDRLVEKVENKERLNLYERLFVDHPSVTFPWKTKEDRTVAALDLAEVVKRDRRKIRVIGIIDRIHERPDKNGDIMGFFGLVGVKGYIRVLCFARSWEKYRERTKLGYLMGMTLSRLDRDEFTWSLDSKNGNLKLYGRPKRDDWNKSNMPKT